MKLTTLLFVLSILGFSLVGCDQKTVKSSSSNSNNYNNCILYPDLAGCSGTTTGSTTSGTGTTSCATHAYLPTCPGYQTAINICMANPNQTGCTGFCTAYPTVTTCSGSSTGGTSGGSYPTIPVVNNWGEKYKGYSGNVTTVPTCGVTNISGLNPTRKATLTMSGAKQTANGSFYQFNGYFFPGYSPTFWQNGGDIYSHNISPWLTDINQAVAFASTDSRLKVRTIPRPQPGTSGGTYCYGRTSGSPHYQGYTKLAATVSLRPLQNVVKNSAGNITSYKLGNALQARSFTTNIMSCSPILDFSGYCSGPGTENGCAFTVEYVTVNQGCTNVWDSQGNTCTWMVDVQSNSCWQLDLEVASDDTQDLN